MTITLKRDVSLPLASPLSIRPGTGRDVAMILKMIRGLAEYEHLAHEVKATAARLQRDGSGRRPYFRTLVCSRGRKIVGFALYFYTYSTFAGRPSLYVEDLFVLPEERGKGAGTALLRDLGRIALRTGCGRMEWMVRRENDPAIRFYKGIGARLHDEWIVTRLGGMGLRRLAKNQQHSLARGFRATRSSPPREAPMLLPTSIVHADWGTAAHKRWRAEAVLGADGRYTAHAPTPIQNHADLIPSIRNQIHDGGCALVGFDFPIGIPTAYAGLAGITAFKTFLRGLGRGEWADFYNVATVRAEISVHRPFYPYSPGGKKQAHLLQALGLNQIDDLRRECEKKQPGRRAACPLFWTLGANQVGKGAIVGWRDVLAPALSNDKEVLLWPFDGALIDLLQPGRIVIVETYPAECYGWFLAEPLRGKGQQEVRRSVARHLKEWAASLGLSLERALLEMIERGFPEGDDAFDTVVGLMGMIAW